MTRCVQHGIALLPLLAALRGYYQYSLPVWPMRSVSAWVCSGWLAATVLWRSWPSMPILW